MPKLWSQSEATSRRGELEKLYIRNNLPLKDVAWRLGLSQAGIYYRLRRLNIPIIRSRKPGFNNIRQDVVMPTNYSPELAEFIGIFLGDGGLRPTQVTITIHSNEGQYIQYILDLIEKIFAVKARAISRINENAKCIYFGSTRVVRFLLSMGLAENKVQQQVAVPIWIKKDITYQQACLRGLVDTGGSVYKLRYGVQASLTNRSIPLIQDARAMMVNLGYHPSRISDSRIYLTKRQDLIKYYREIGFANNKHSQRFLAFMGAEVREVVKPSRL